MLYELVMVTWLAGHISDRSVVQQDLPFNACMSEVRAQKSGVEQVERRNGKLYRWVYLRCDAQRKVAAQTPCGRPYCPPPQPSPTERAVKQIPADITRAIGREITREISCAISGRC